MIDVGHVASAALRIVRGPHRRSQVLERLRDRLVLFDAGAAQLARTSRVRAIAVGFSYDKRRLLRQLYPDRRFVFAPAVLDSRKAERLLRLCPDHELWSWSFADAALEELLSGRRKGWTRVEDGFIRSDGLGVHGAAARSFCIDRSGLHFDATRPSELEELCHSFDGRAHAGLVRRAERLMAILTRYRVTKYAAGRTSRLKLPAGTVLVLGQVEDDKSILCNPQGFTTNQALLEKALAENDTAKVYYRPHPDVAAGARLRLSNPETLVPPENVVAAEEPVADLLDAAAHIYVISSLGGFEALMRGAKVSTFGAPFYAGWGLTRDYLTFPRRTRTLTVAELFACAYVLYPIYFDPWNGRKVEIEHALSGLLGDGRKTAAPTSGMREDC